MRYQLFREDDLSAVLLESEDLQSEFAATEWAREWVKAHADHDRYRLQQSDGGRATLLLRTIAGQWYVMPLPEEGSAVAA